MSLLAAPSRAEVGAIGTAASLASRLWGLLLKGLHLLMKLSGKLLILFSELADSVLRNPVIPLLYDVVSTYS